MDGANRWPRTHAPGAIGREERRWLPDLFFGLMPTSLADLCAVSSLCSLLVRPRHTGAGMSLPIRAVARPSSACVFSQPACFQQEPNFRRCQGDQLVLAPLMSRAVADMPVGAAVPFGGSRNVVGNRAFRKNRQVMCVCPVAFLPFGGS